MSCDGLGIDTEGGPGIEAMAEQLIDDMVERGRPADLKTNLETEFFDYMSEHVAAKRAEPGEDRTGSVRPT